MKNSYLLKVGKLCLVALTILLSTQFSRAQLSGLKNIPGDYADLGLAIADLNAQGVGPGGVLFNVLASNPQSAPAGGYQITATGTVATPIQFVGNNNVVTASGALTVGALNDAIFKLIGSDYVSIGGFVMQENPANTVTTAASNNMTEWGVALFYNAVTNGAQNCTIAGNSIALNRNYANTFGIYANSTHTPAAVTTSATATGATGGNHGLKIYGNSISNVNMGIIVVGPTAAADQNDGIDIGGTGGGMSNIISNYGTTGTFSSYANVSGTVNGILVRNSKNINISHNTITSSVGGTTAGTLRGIFIPSFTNGPTGTFTNTINNNTISVQSAVSAGGVEGITHQGTSATTTSTLTINNNNFVTSGHTVGGASGTITFINTAAPHLTTSINNNTFTALSVNTIGSVTFISHTYNLPAAGTCNINSNSIVTGFSKTGAGGTVTGTTTNGSSPNTAFTNYLNNNFSNITVTGGTTVTVINNTDGSGSSPTKTITGNTFNSITGGTSPITGVNISYVNGTSSISNNTFTAITGQNNITGFNIGSSFNGANPLLVSNNTISNLSSTGTGGNVTGIVCSNTSPDIRISNNAVNTFSSTGASLVSGISVNGATATSVFGNKVHTLSSSNIGGTVFGIQCTGGTTVNLRNNIIGDLTASIGSGTDVIRGINVSGGTTVNVHYNTVQLNATSSGANFGSSAISVTTGPTVELQNNIFVNNSAQNGTGLAVAYRRSSTTLTSYGANSNRNDFVGTSIYTDGTTTDATLAAYQATVAPRDAAAISSVPSFLSTTPSNSNYLHIDPAISTPLESGAANIAGITTDFDNETRQGNGGYSGTGTAPDIGADEFELAVVNCSSASGGTIAPGTGSMCVGSTNTITSTGATTGNGISYQWKVSTISGGPYSNVTGGIGATTVSYITTALPAGTYYFVLETTCSFGPVVGVSNEYTLTVNPNPTIVANPSSATYCVPGAGVSITASGANTYSWSPATGLSGTTGATVTASPLANTTYTVTGTDINGCIGNTTSVITVAATPVISSVTATPTAVCNGSNSQLVANASVLYNNTAAAYSFAGSTESYAAITGTTLGASSIGDDVGIGNLPIGFTFPYNGNNFTVFGARSNGLIELGQVTAVLSGLSGNALSTTANCIAPLWDDNNTTGGSIIYSTTGSAPNRVLTVQWTAMHVGGTGSAAQPTIDCQLQLFETTGVIKFIYGSTSAAFTSTTASIGISGLSGNYLSVTPLSPASASTVSSSSENTGISAATNFPTGTVYTFTPPVAPVLTYAWSPATYLSSTSISNPVAMAVTTPETYTVTVTSTTGCVNTGNVSLTVNPLPSAVTASNSAQCGAQVPTASVTSTTGAPTPTFTWYDAPTAGNLMQSSTSTTFTSVVSSTTTFYVSEVDGTTGCESARTPVTITVAAADGISASIDNAIICIGSSVVLTAANTNPTPNQSYTYTWVGTAGSGIASQVGSPITVTPTVPGTYTYDLTGVDGGCSAVSSVNVTVDPFTSTVTPINVTCNGYNNGSFSQGATTCGTGPYTYSVDGGAFGPIPTNLTPGSHTVVTMNIGGFTSASQSITITEPSTTIAAPTGTNASVCLNDVTANVSATSNTNTTNTVNTSVTFDLVAQPAVIGTATVPSTTALNPNAIATATLPALPAGATVTGVTFTMNGLTPLGGSWANDVYFGFSGAYGANYQNGTGAPGSTTPFNFTRAYTGTYAPAGGTVSLHYYDRYDDNAGVECTFPTGTSVGTLTVTYTVPVPATITWWDAASNGTQIGSGSPLNAVGTSVLPNTSTPGTYTLYAQGEFGGCNGVTRTAVTVTVNALPTVDAGTGQTVCSGTSVTLTGSGATSYTWDNGVTNGTPFSATATTTYTVTGTDVNGCQNTDAVLVTVNSLPTVGAGTDLAVCTGGSVTLTGTGTATGYSWNNGVTDGVAFTPVSTLTYTVTGTDGNGCQNTDVVVVTVNTPTSGSETQTACSSYTWAANGTNYTTSGTYTAILPNAAGCDSTATLNLTINMPSTGSETQIACDSYTWPANGATYTTGGTYTATLPNAVGCDSVITLTLTINQSSTGSETQTACSSYTWPTNGTMYTTSGTYTATLPNAVGCDSVVTLTLTINQPSTGSETQTACSSFTWPANGTTYTTGGTYTATLPNSVGCDSVVTLTLIINQPSTGSETQTACDSYTWPANGTTYTTGGTYTATLPNSVGCDSVVTLTLIINQSSTGSETQTACGSYTWPANGTTYTTGGTYTATLPNSVGCDSIVTLTLTINSIPTATATDNGDATITASAGSTYQWIDCSTGNPVAGATAQTFAPVANGNYAVIVGNASGCSDTSSCVLIDNIGIEETATINVSVFPNPTHNEVTVVMSASAATIEVVDAQGKLLQVTHVISGGKVDLSTYETGVYFLRIKTENGSVLERIVKN